MTKKTTLIIAIQAILIIALFWVLVFYSKDEFEAYQNTQQEEIESLNRVSTTDGINIVSLNTATQQNSGIQTTKINSASFNGTVKSFGNVVSIDSLTEAKSRYLTLKTELILAKANSTHNLKQYERLKALNADDKNVSDQALQIAQADVQADSARISASELQIKNLQNNTKLQWGEQLAKLAFEDPSLKNKLPPNLADLLSRKNVLIQISLPLITSAPKPGDSVNLTPLNETVAPIKAVFVSPATQTDTNGFGKTFYYSAPADLLRIGMRVNVVTESATNENTNGVVIPSNAVVWYAGKAWAYFKQGQNKNVVQFVRKPISTDTEVDSGNSGGWFNQGISEDSEVVINGAQLLLSEEFKNQIKNENED
jgi:hypothetical protein